MLVLISVIFPVRTVFKQSLTVVIVKVREEVFVVFERGSKIFVAIVTVKTASRSTAIGILNVKVLEVGLWVIQEG